MPWAFTASSIKGGSQRRTHLRPDGHAGWFGECARLAAAPVQITGDFLQAYCFVSHRWEIPEEPDPQGVQQSLLLDYIMR